MLFLKKIVAMLLQPLALVLLLLALAAWLRRRWPVWIAAGLLYLASTGLVAGWLQGALESHSTPLAIVAAGPADAVAVLGGIVGPPAAPDLMPNLSEAVERLEAGIRLLQQGRAPLLVFMAARIPWDDRVIVEGELLRREALARGIAPDRILMSGEVGDTADEAAAVAALARERGWKRVILVTSAWHMPRAAHLFRGAGVPITPFPVDYRYDPRKPLSLLDFLPSAQALATTEGIMRECYGLLFYQLKSLWSPG